MQAGSQSALLSDSTDLTARSSDLTAAGAVAGSTTGRTNDPPLISCTRSQSKQSAGAAPRPTQATGARDVLARSYGQLH